MSKKIHYTFICKKMSVFVCPSLLTRVFEIFAHLYLSVFVCLCLSFFKLIEWVDH